MLQSKNAVAILLSLAIGCLCVVLAYLYLTSLAPSLKVSLIARGNELLLRFSNTGKERIRLDSAGMEYFIFSPANDSREYVVMVKPRQWQTMREKAMRESLLAVLQPGEYVDAVNVYPLLRGLPPGSATLEAVYTAPVNADFAGVWHGTARSAVIPLSIN